LLDGITARKVVADLPRCKRADCKSAVHRERGGVLFTALVTDGISLKRIAVMLKVDRGMLFTAPQRGYHITMLAIV
jgi:hypothetical protein